MDYEESGDPVIDSRGFRRCLGQYATGVVIITAAVQNHRVGLTANSFTSLSLDPPLIVWALSRKSRSFGPFTAAEHFAVNVLSQGQVTLSQRFSSMEEDKFAGVDWSEGIGGAPLISGAIAGFECEKETIYEGGDHLILVGRVRRFTRSSGQPLLFVQGRYALPDTLPEVKPVTASPASNKQANGNGLPLSSLLFRAHRHASEQFERYRTAEGLTSTAHSRILFTLGSGLEISLSELVESINLPFAVAEDAASELEEQGLVVRGLSGNLRLTPAGVERSTSFRARLAHFESELLTGVAQADLQHAKEFLSSFIQRHAPPPRAIEEVRGSPAA